MSVSDGVQNVVFAVGRITPNGIKLLGTAFALDKNAAFATASHVVESDDRGLVLVFKIVRSFNDYQDTSDNSVQSFPVKISALDPFHDLAILTAEQNINVFSQIQIEGADAALVGSLTSNFGYPHADHGRMVLTQQDAEIGARVLISSGGIKSKHLVLNTQARPGQSGSPVFIKNSKLLVGVLVGSYAPGGGGGISLAGIDPNTLHQTTHVVSAEYLKGMY